MKQILKLIGSFIFALIFLGVISHLMVQNGLLTPEEQARYKENKTYWRWAQHQENPLIHYLELGEGSNHVVLVHGFRANMFTWRHLLEPLKEAGFHVWAFDLIGYGFSDKPNISYDPSLFVRLIMDFMKEKNIDKAQFIGSSMGGGLCINLALEDPEGVASITLISPLAYPLDLPLSISIARNFGFLWGPFIGPTMIRKGLQQLVCDKNCITQDQINAYALPYRFPGGTEAAHSTLKNFDNDRLQWMSSHYKDFPLPTMIIWGDKDTLIPLDHYRYFCRDMPTATTLLLKECGHIPHEEKPDQVVPAIIAFLKKNLMN